jgi:cell division protein FtsB
MPDSVALLITSLTQETLQLHARDEQAEERNRQQVARIQTLEEEIKKLHEQLPPASKPVA